MGVYRSSDRPVIPRQFFKSDPIRCARELIGCELVWQGCSGIVVETEAYSVVNDEASHTFNRPSAREFVAARQPGAAYVYFNYGVHWMLNVLVKGGREDGFVLFRAIEPREGVEKMEARRKQTALANLCSGPGKLAQALGVTGRDHGRDFCAGEEIGLKERAGRVKVEVDVRIGISKAAHLPWRFLLKESRFVSVRPQRGVEKK